MSEDPTHTHLIKEKLMEDDKIIRIDLDPGSVISAVTFF